MRRRNASTKLNDQPNDLKDADITRLAPGFAWTAKRRVCIVTTEFHGLFKNGGIGTANTGLALTLAEAGCDVTVLFANLPIPPDAELRRLRERYRKDGIKLEVIFGTPSIPKPFSSARSASYAVYLFLRDHEFDVVYFHDNCGRGFYSLAAKHAACFPAPPLMFVVAHGPSEWVYELNALRYYGTEPVITDFIERKCVEFADALISPSRYLVDWMKIRGWKLPAHVFVEQNIVRTTALSLPSPQSTAIRPIKEIAFFGRNEVRKGIALFCDAIDLLKARIDLEGLRITFLGKFSEIDGMHSGIYVIERSIAWNTPVRILAKLDQIEALRYLSRDGTLAVIPSLVENSPCVVLECLKLGIPFIATDSGGTSELVNPADAPFCLVPPKPETLADRLAETLKTGHPPARLSVPAADTEKRWRSFHGLDDSSNATTEAAAVPAPSHSGIADHNPLVSICLIARDESPELERVLDAILSQSYSDFEVIIAGADGSDPAVMQVVREAVERDKAERSGRFILTRHLDSASARDLLAKQARGQFLLFLDESNVVLASDCLAVLVRAAIRTNADIVTGFSLKFEHDAKPREGQDGEVHTFPVGACVEGGIVENCFGDALALVRAEAFSKMAGFLKSTDSQNISYWHSLAAAVLSGASLEIVPQPVFWHLGKQSFDQNRSRFLEHYRRLLGLYGFKQIEAVKHLFERFIDLRAENKIRLERMLNDIAPALRHLVLRLTGQDPNSKEAIDGFLRYSIERGRVQEALEFALYNGATDGAVIHWVKKETAIDFEWPFPIPWELKLRIGRLYSRAQAERIHVFVGDVALPVKATIDNRGDAHLHVTGLAGSPKSPLVSVRVLLPYACHASDTSRDVGLNIEMIVVKAVGSQLSRPVDGQLESDPSDDSGRRRSDVEMTPNVVEPVIREQAPIDVESAVVDAMTDVPPPTANTQRLSLSAAIGGSFAIAESFRLDQRQVGEWFRHLDFSVVDVTFDGEFWSAMKFKFCVTPTERLLEFRETPTWPVVFTEFPGDQHDSYGRVWRLTENDISTIVSWKAERDKLALQSIFALLPGLVEQIANTDDFSREERNFWSKEAKALSSKCLDIMRKRRLGVFRQARLSRTARRIAN